MIIWLSLILLAIIILVYFYYSSDNKKDSFRYEPGFAGNIYRYTPVIRVYEFPNYSGRYMDLSPGWWKVPFAGSIQFLAKQYYWINDNRVYHVRSELYDKVCQYPGADGFKCQGGQGYIFDDIPDLSKRGWNPSDKLRCLHIYLEPDFHAQLWPYFSKIYKLQCQLRGVPYKQE
jgi:hypothetical protein